jgi:predicted nucleotidyltransferase
MSALDVLPADRRPVVGALVDAVARVPGVTAVALGGSWARGTARPESDVDLALYAAKDHPSRWIVEVERQPA